MNQVKVLGLLKEGQHKKVKLAVCDMDGILRGKSIHIDKLSSILEKGFGFCSVIFGWDSGDVCYDNSKYTGWHTGYPDAHAKLDANTLRFIPWDCGTPFFLADFIDERGKPLDICPRQLLKKTDKKLNDLGFKGKVGCEYEWFNFKESSESLEEKNYGHLNPLTSGMFGYSLLRSSQNSEFFNDLQDSLREFRVPLEGIHTETGPGVYEAALCLAGPLEACDRAVLFKTAAKEIAQKHGVMPSFMARWSEEYPGCSGHVHISLEEGKNGTNVFYDARDKHGMSDIFKSFLAGLIKGVPELLPMMAPTINSYKRLVKGFWAPVQMTWGIDNRTCAFRVINNSPSSTRVEVRVPGSDMNAYLAVAAIIAAGTHGIEQKLKLESDPFKGNAYEDEKAPKLASNLSEATTLMSQSQLAHELLGENFVKHFTDTREWEWRQYQASVSHWERKRYFEII